LLCAGVGRAVSAVTVVEWLADLVDGVEDEPPHPASAAARAHSDTTLAILVRGTIRTCSVDALIRFLSRDWIRVRAGGIAQVVRTR